MIFSFIGYLFTIGYHNEKQVPFKPNKSVSAGYYDLPAKLRWMCFMSYMGFAVPAMILAAHVLVILAASSIMFTAVAAAYRQDRLTLKVHIYSANIGIALSQLYVVMNNWWLVLFFGIPSILMLIFNLRTRVYWIEILAFLTMAITIGLNH